MQTYRIAAREKSIQDACNLYSDFTEYLSSVSSSSNEDSTTKTTLMSTLRKIQNEDEPTSLESCVQFQVEQDVVVEEEVGAVFDIDWGITLEDEEDVEETSNGDEIDWGITMEDDDNETEDMEITVEDEGEEKKEEEITTSLVDSSIRETLLDDLEELICFLTQRTNELKESESGYAMSSGKDVPQSVKTQTLHGIQNVLDDVKSLRDRLTSPDFRAKILIASSLSYRNRLAKQILSLRHRTVKLEGKKIQALDRRNLIRSSISNLEPRVLRTVTVAKKLRSELETLISSSLNDRKIKIMSTGLR